MTDSEIFCLIVAGVCLLLYYLTGRGPKGPVDYA